MGNENEGGELYTHLREDKKYITINTKIPSQWCLSVLGLFRLKNLRKQMADEDEAELRASKTLKLSSFSSKGAWVAAGLTLLGIIVTLYFGCNPKSTRSYSNATDSAKLGELFRRLDSVKKAISDSTMKAQPSDVIMTPVSKNSGVAILEPPPPPPPDYKKHSKKQIDSIMKRRSPTLQGDEKK
jgi:hypothetical protein